MWSFRPYVGSPEVASHGLVKVDSNREKQHRLQHRLLKMLLLALFCRRYLNRSSVLHDLRNLDDYYVNLGYILYKVITTKCCGSLYAVTFTLTLIPCKSTSGKSISNIPRIYLRARLFELGLR